MKHVKKFLLVWALIVSFLCAIVFATYLLYLLSQLAIWISPSYGTHVFVTLFISAIVSAAVVGASEETVGGAPY